MRKRIYLSRQPRFRTNKILLAISSCYSIILGNFIHRSHTKFRAESLTSGGLEASASASLIPKLNQYSTTPPVINSYLATLISERA